jgi:hypothetical protein
VVYTVGAVGTTWQAARQWRPLLSGSSAQGERELAWKLGFFLLTPVGVLAHELAHLLTARQ